MRCKQRSDAKHNRHTIDANQESTRKWKNAAWNSYYEDSTILWDTIKIAMRGRWMPRAAYQFKSSEEGYRKLGKQLTTLKKQHEYNKDNAVLQQIISVRRQIDD